MGILPLLIPLRLIQRVKVPENPVHGISVVPGVPPHIQGVTMAVVVPFPGGKHRLYTQLDTGAPTRKQDCQVLVVINNILSASRGRVGPKSKSEVKTWVRMVRRWANRPTGALKLRTHVLSAY